MHHLKVLERIPDSPENLYRIRMTGILRFLFPESQRFDVNLAKTRGSEQPHIVVFKFSNRPGGSTHAYEFCYVESKKLGQSRESVEYRCRECCADDGQFDYETYAIVHVGFEMRFYKYRRRKLLPLSERLPVRGDVKNVIEWAEYMKNYPLPFLGS